MRTSDANIFGRPAASTTPTAGRPGGFTTRTTPAGRPLSPDLSTFALRARPPISLHADMRGDPLLARFDALAATLDAEGQLEVPTEWRRRSAAFGLPGIDLPAAVGGKDLPIAEVAKIFEHAGRYSLNLRDVVGGGHGRALLKSREPQAQELLADLARGNLYFAIAITEPYAGTEMRAMQAESERSSGGYVLTGKKLFNARLEDATHVIVFARAPDQDEGRSTRLNAFVLPTDHPGLEYVTLHAHGLTGNSFGGVSFDHVEVPESARIGEDGEGGQLFREHFLYWRLMQSAAAVGTGKGALSVAAHHLLNRSVGGRPIAAFTHLQQPLGMYAGRLEMAMSLVQRAAHLMDEGRFDEAAPLVNMAKAEGVEMALEAADHTMNALGARSFTNDFSDVGQRRRDLEGLRFADGTTDVLRGEVVQQLYGRVFRDLALGVTPPSRPEEDPGLPQGALAQLQAALRTDPRALALHGDYTRYIREGGGGACPTVAAANALQAVGVMAGREEPFDVAEALERLYEENDALRDGRLSNAQVAQVLEGLADAYLPEVPVSLRVDYQRALDPLEQPEGAHGWTDLDSSLLSTQRGELKLVSFDMTTPRDGRLGRHFVLLQSREGDRISVVDPNHPRTSDVYEVKQIELPDGGHTFALEPADRPSSTQRHVNSVLTLTLHRAN